MKKTMIVLSLILALVVLSACGSSGENSTASTVPTTTAPTSTAATAPSADPSQATEPLQQEPVPSYGQPAASQGSTAPSEPEKVNDTFGFEAVLTEGNTVEKGKIFYVKVTTTNISGKEVQYQGSSTIIGATIYLSTQVGEYTILFQPEGMMTTKDVTKVTIQPGQSITTTWTFADYSGVVPGVYDLHFSFQGYTGVLEDFVTIQ